MPSIALRQHTFDVGPFTYAHNYLVLYDDHGNVIEELHGQPADPATGKELNKYIGRTTDNLGAFPNTGRGRLNSVGQDEKSLWQGADAMTRWQAAKDAVDHINKLKLTYNLWGSDLNGPRDWDAPTPSIVAGNSNSVNRTLIDAMGLQVPSMPTSAPGIENQLLPQSLLDQIHRNNGLPPRPKGGLF